MRESEYSTKQMIGYFLVVNKSFTNYNEKLLHNYINKLKEELETTEKMYILGKVNIKDFADFFINYQVNAEEIICFAIVVFNRLLNYYNRKFGDKEIIKEVETIMRLYSPRTVQKEAKTVLDKFYK